MGSSSTVSSLSVLRRMTSSSDSIGLALWPGALRRDPKAVCIVGSPPQAEEAERYERVVASLETEVGVDEALTRGAALTQDDAAALVRSVIESARG
jgi:hypothetical protein